MKEVKQEINDMPREKLRHRLTIHYAMSLPRTDDKAVLRSMNLYHIQQEMERDEQVNAAFADLEKKLERGEKVSIRVPFVDPDSDGIYSKWNMFSSEVFTKYLLWEIDNLDFRHCT
jgi:hypothetical protein